MDAARRYSALEYRRLGRWTPVRDRVVGAATGGDAAGAPATPGTEGAGDAAIAGGGAAGGAEESESESDSERPGDKGARPEEVAARPESRGSPEPGGGPEAKPDRPAGWVREPSMADGEVRTGGEEMAAGTC